MLPSLIDRLGDAKDQVRDQDQSLLLKIMEQAATPQVSISDMLEIKQLTNMLTVFAVFVGQNVGKLQAQEQQDERRTVPLSHRHSEYVSRTSSPDMMIEELCSVLYAR